MVRHTNSAVALWWCLSGCYCFRGIYYFGYSLWGRTCGICFFGGCIGLAITAARCGMVPRAVLMTGPLPVTLSGAASPIGVSCNKFLHGRFRHLFGVLRVLTCVHNSRFLLWVWRVSDSRLCSVWPGGLCWCVAVLRCLGIEGVTIPPLLAQQSAAQIWFCLCVAVLRCLGIEGVTIPLPLAQQSAAQI